METKTSDQLVVGAEQDYRYKAMVVVLREVLNDADSTGCEDCAVVSGKTLERVAAVLATANPG